MQMYLNVALVSVGPILHYFNDIEYIRWTWPTIVVTRRVFTANFKFYDMIKYRRQRKYDNNQFNVDNRWGTTHMCIFKIASQCVTTERYLRMNYRA